MLGDDVLNRIDEFLAKGYEMRNLDTCAPLATIRDRILSANAYTGAFPLAEALATERTLSWPAALPTPPSHSRP